MKRITEKNLKFTKVYQHILLEPEEPEFEFEFKEVHPTYTKITTAVPTFHGFGLCRSEEILNSLHLM